MKRIEVPPLLTDAELDAYSAMTPAEREDAQRMWKEDAPPPGRALLDAPEYEGEDGG